MQTILVPSMAPARPSAVTETVAPSDSPHSEALADELRAARERHAALVEEKRRVEQERSRQREEAQQAGVPRRRFDLD